MPRHPSIPENPEESDTDIPHFKKCKFFGSNTSSVIKSTDTGANKSDLTPARPKTLNMTKSPDHRSRIASIELQSPSVTFHFFKYGNESTQLINFGGSGRQSPMQGFSNERGLTILSPHNPPPDLQFGPSITLRTRNGKSIVLPKLRMPSSLPPDSSPTG